MTISPPLLPTGVPYPVWDPGPRKPRHHTRWLALLSAAVAVIIATPGAQRIFGSDYTAQDDACATLDLSPLAQALDAPTLRATPADSPSASPSPDTSGAAERKECRFRIEDANGSPRAAGTVTITWFGHAVEGAVLYETQREQARGTVKERVEVLDVPDLGERAYTSHDPKAKPAQNRVAALDSNLLLDLRVAVALGEPVPPPALLAASLKASFSKLHS